MASCYSNNRKAAHLPYPLFFFFLLSFHSPHTAVGSPFTSTSSFKLFGVKSVYSLTNVPSHFVLPSFLLPLILYSLCHIQSSLPLNGLL